MRQKYDHISVNVESISQMAALGLNNPPPNANAALEEPITLEELLLAVKKRKANKSPGREGIYQEFFKTTWEWFKQDMLALLNHMYMDGILTDNNKHGILMCLPIQPDATSLEDCRPMTLLNADYKLLARIISDSNLGCMAY